MASCLPLPELIFLSPKTRTPKHHHRLLSLSRHSLYTLNVSSNKIKLNLPLRTPVIRALKEDTAVIEDREREILKELNGNGNGNGRVNGSVERYVNGGLVGAKEGESSSNESLVKYVNGNGSAAVVTTEILVEEKKEGRKKRIEEIGKEDAWFKRADEQQLEVSVAPGGKME
ncbi:hypothetical protein OIU76_024896 [Salix suchowensis]|nr:hypothetical protein OIU76_024896 [Salix suchowensis]